MPRRTRSRATALTGVLLLALGGLAACGEDEGAGATGQGLESLTIEGAPGKEPKVKWDGRLVVSETESEVLAEGDGEPVEDGDSVLAHLWVGNGFTQDGTFSTWTTKPELLTVDDQLSGPLKEGVVDRNVGSRVAVAAPAEDAFGEAGNPQLGIGNKDTVVFIVDVITKIATEPHGEAKTPAKWAPTLIEDDKGTITGFDFSTAHKPGGKLLETTLVKGDGPVVETGQTIYVNYLGQVYNAEKPFDESYSKGTPASFPIGVGQVVKGWDQALVGNTVGSRVILEIPPVLGYGDKGNEGAGIKGTDTLFFVVDILGAA